MMVIALGVLGVVLISACMILLLVVSVGLFLEVAECLPAKWRAIKRAWAGKDGRW